MPSLSPRLGRGESHPASLSGHCQPHPGDSSPGVLSVTQHLGKSLPQSLLFSAAGAGGVWGVSGGEQPFPHYWVRVIVGCWSHRTSPCPAPCTCLLSPLPLSWHLTPSPFIRVKKGAVFREAKGLAAFLERQGGENQGIKEKWLYYYCFENCGEVQDVKLVIVTTFKHAVHWFSSVTQSCPTLCDPMDCSTPGLPVHHQLPEFTQTHVHWVGDAIQPSHPLSSPSPAFNLSQHQSLFQWSVLHFMWPKY